MVDWYPTLLKLAGVSLDQKLPLDGRDAWPTIAAGKPSPHEEILLNTEAARGAIRVGDWKLVLNGNRMVTGEDEPDGATSQTNTTLKTETERVELFNLASDLSERTNLASTQKEKVKELRVRYERFARQAVPPKVMPKPPGFQSPPVWGEFK
jgi:arylsulfatase A-like enzyme